MERLRVGLFNDSFPPVIDGVAQTVKNYARVLQKDFCDVTVVTPHYQGVVDDYPFEVYRYSSLPIGKRIGYRMGNVISPHALFYLRKKQFDLLHIHSPFASSLLASNVNRGRRVPVVLTYHTKFDIDIAKRVGHLTPLKKAALKFVRHNINMADEVWVVTEGCGRALQDIGYKGRYYVMENGTDFAYGRAAQNDIELLRETYNLPEEEFVFLFVGRMMWYKNTRLILDSLKILQKEGVPFRAFMIGDGYDAPDIRAYSQQLGLSNHVTFTGAIYDREYLRVFYSVADVFLFPSTYDTSGIVVKEAAACDCPSLLIRDSCAAEGVKHRVSGFLAEENAASCGQVLLEACADRAAIKEVGRAAGQQLYLSWDDAVAKAYARYQEILRIWPGPLPYNAKNPL